MFLSPAKLKALKKSFFIHLLTPILSSLIALSLWVLIFDGVKVDPKSTEGTLLNTTMGVLGFFFIAWMIKGVLNFLKVLKWAFLDRKREAV